MTAEAVRMELERARRVAELLNDERSRATIDAYVRELEIAADEQAGEVCELI